MRERAETGWAGLTLLAAIGVLMIVSLAAHFVPFERVGFESDDHWILWRTQSTPRGDLADEAWSQGDRPLSWWLLFENARFVGLDRIRHVTVVALGSSLLVASVLLLFLEITLQLESGAFLALLFVLWPAHYASHGTAQIAVLSLIACFFIWSATLFLRSARTGNRKALAGSLVCYGAGLLGYELGFFVPLVAWGVGRWQKRPHHQWALAHFGVALVYLARRWAVAGSALSLGPVRVPSWEVLLFNVSWVLPSHFVGHQAARNLLYGAWGFVNLPARLLAGGLVASGLVYAAALRAVPPVLRLGVRANIGLTLAIYVLAAPACLVLVESRHTALASIAFVALLAQPLRRLWQRRRSAAAALLTLLFVGFSAGRNGAAIPLGLSGPRAPQVESRSQPFCGTRQSELRGSDSFHMAAQTK